jgi:inosine-uridine nucleoside N-ribohydrolase
MKIPKLAAPVPSAGALLAVLMFAASFPWNCRAQEPGAPYPVIYSTDLYYSIDDIDDYFDLAVLLKMPGIDLKGVILDNHHYPTDGEKAADKLMSLSGRKVPVVKGLGGFQLRSLEDKGFYVDGQEGVELILKTLAESDRKVALIGVGSMTDFAAAYLRNPSLWAQKVSAVHVVAGYAGRHDPGYNTMLDPNAFLVIMRSNLPIVWSPEDWSMWYFPAQQLLVPEKNVLAHFLLQELLYWYLRNDWNAKVHKDRYEYYGLGRWLWSETAFIHVSRDPHEAEMFDLVPCKVEFDDKGAMSNIQLGSAHSNIQVVKANVNGDKLNAFVVSMINR